MIKCCLKYNFELSLLYKLKFYVDMTNGEPACDMSALFYFYIYNYNRLFLLI